MRELILRQAILNAAGQEDDAGNIAFIGVKTFLKCCTTSSGYVRETLCARVRVEFAGLWEAYLEKQEELRNEIANMGEC